MVKHLRDMHSEHEVKPNSETASFFEKCDEIDQDKVIDEDQ
jgi:riboflavin biosynthesis RibT protein